MSIAALTPSALTNSRRTSDRQRCVSGILTMCEINVLGSDGHLSRVTKINSRGLSNRRAARASTGRDSLVPFPGGAKIAISKVPAPRVGKCRGDDQWIANTMP